MYEYQILKEIFDGLNSSTTQESDIKTTKDLDDLYSKIKLPNEV